MLSKICPMLSIWTSLLLFGEKLRFLWIGLKTLWMKVTTELTWLPEFSPVLLSVFRSYLCFLEKYLDISLYHTVHSLEEQTIEEKAFGNILGKGENAAFFLFPKTFFSLKPKQISTGVKIFIMLSASASKLGQSKILSLVKGESCFKFDHWFF